MRQLLVAASLLVSVNAAFAQMRITEWAYSAAGGEFIEFTNVGASSINMAGWSFDDDNPVPGTISLSAFGIVAPGQSVILTEETASSFAASWGLTGIAIIGGNTANLGRNDQINLFDGSNALIDRLTFGDQNIAGTIRTQNVSGIPSSSAALGANDVHLWQLAANGDAFGSRTSLLGDVGSPGFYVPEPGSMAMILLGSVFAIRRR